MGVRPSGHERFDAEARGKSSCLATVSSAALRYFHFCVKSGGGPHGGLYSRRQPRTSYMSNVVTLHPRRLPDAVGTVTVDDLVRVVLHAEQQRANLARASHPRLFPGAVAYAERVAGLREQLGPLGWTSFNRQFLEGVLSPDKDVAIVPVTMLCEVDRMVVRTWPKGPRMREVIELNYWHKYGVLPTAKQLLLLGEEGAHEDPNGPLTYILLVHREGSMVRAELALPIRATASRRRGFSVECAERWPFMLQNLEPEAQIDVHETSAQEIDFQIDELDT